MSNTRSAYRGKYPHRIKSVVSTAPGWVLLTANNGESVEVSARAAAHAVGAYRMPEIGDDFGTWRQIARDYDCLLSQVFSGLTRAMESIQSIHGQASLFDPMRETQLLACFLACAMQCAYIAADKMVHGRKWNPASRAFSYSVGEGGPEIENAFTVAYVSRIERLYPHGVPVLTCGHICTRGRDSEKARHIIGVGLIA